MMTPARKRDAAVRMPEASDREAGMRILMTADAVGGVWQYALDLTETLSARGVETTLAVFGPSPSADQQAMAEAAGIRLILTGLPLDWTAANSQEVEEAGRNLARIAAQEGPDLVHLNSPALAAGGAFSTPVVAVCHSCVATWWRAVRSGPLPDDLAWRSDLTRSGYRAADMLLAPTAAFAQATAEAHELEKTPTVVRNGRRIQGSSATDVSGPFVFTAGRLWDEGKNFATIDRVARHLQIPVLAAGPLDGPNGARIEARHARALGRLSDADVARHLGAKPIFVSAARYEPFGLAVLEAAQAGCALILSDIPTFRELWDGAAIFAPPDDEGAFVQAVEHLTRNADVWSSMEAAAEKRAEGYTVDAMGAGVLSAYRSLVDLKSNRSPVEGAAA